MRWSPFSPLPGLSVPNLADNLFAFSYLVTCAAPSFLVIEADNSRKHFVKSFKAICFKPMSPKSLIVLASCVDAIHYYVHCPAPSCLGGLCGGREAVPAVPVMCGLIVAAVGVYNLGVYANDAPRDAELRYGRTVYWRGV